jgi:hypothetical protein
MTKDAKIDALLDYMRLIRTAVAQDFLRHLGSIDAAEAGALLAAPQSPAALKAVAAWAAVLPEGMNTEVIRRAADSLAAAKQAARPPRKSRRRPQHY